MGFAEVAAAALSRAPELLRQWCPDGDLRGHEYVALNPRRADSHKGSFSINTSTGAWADFATGDKGGDLISLYSYLNGLQQGESARALAEILGLNGDSKPRAKKQTEPLITFEEFSEKKGFEANWLREHGVVPAPDGGILFRYFEKDGTPSQRHHRRLHWKADPRFKWTGLKGTTIIPYGRETLTHAGDLHLVEGDSDRLTMLLHRYQCLGVPGADMWKVVAAEDVAGYARIIIHRDSDTLTCAQVVLRHSHMMGRSSPAYLHHKPRWGASLVSASSRHSPGVPRQHKLDRMG